MNHVLILLVCGETDRERCHERCERVVAGWPPDAVPRCRVVTFDQFSAMERPAQPPVVWIWLEEGQVHSDLFFLVDRAESWRAPILLTRPKEVLPLGSTLRDGTLIAPPHATDADVRLLLQALASQSPALRELDNELLITRRQNGGIRGQLDKLDEELRLAAQIQRGFLPQQLPHCNDVRFNVLFRPAGYVSGDIYDVRQIDDEHVGFYVADAVGHGVPAALITMFIRHCLPITRAAGQGDEPMRPDHALAELNRQMLQRPSHMSQFATACYGVLNCRTHRLQLARAGHPAALLLRGECEVIELDPSGPLLGVFEDESFDLLELDLERGDRLLLYTDGFELAFNAPGDAANSKHLDELFALRNGTLIDAIQQLIYRLDRCAGSLHQQDDLTALLMGIEPRIPASQRAATLESESAAA